MGRLFIFGVSSLAPGQKLNPIAAVRGLLTMGAFKPVSLMNDNRGVFGVNMGHLWDHAADLRVMIKEMLALFERVTAGQRPYPAAGLVGAAPAPDPKPAPAPAADADSPLWPKGVIIALIALAAAAGIVRRSGHYRPA